MDFRDLTYVVAIAKHQNVTRAAQELYVSQPTLSKFIQSLEGNLGQPLFRKVGNKFLLTYAGERYVEKARMILAMKHELDQELSDIVRDDIGELKIAFPIMRGTYMLPCTMPVFQKQFPNVKVIVHEANSNTLEAMLLSGEIDLAFFTLPVSSPDINYEIISHEEIVLLAAPDHPLAEAGVSKSECKYPWMDLRLVEHERFVLQKKDQRTRQITDQLFREAGIEPNIVLAVRNILASVQLATDGFGMTFVGETHLRHIQTKRTPVCFSVGKGGTTTNFVAAFRRGAYLPTYTRQFIQIVRDFT